MAKKPEPYAPLPPRPQLRVRVKPGGPHVDLGISYSELIVGILDTLNELCTFDQPMDPALRTALDAINVHRGVAVKKACLPESHLGPIDYDGELPVCERCNTTLILRPSGRDGVELGEATEEEIEDGSL